VLQPCSPLFFAADIEELTRKTGNFKQFLVFTTMLESAINKSSESVTLDLLTYADLETLRERRNAMAATTSTAGPGGAADSHTRSARPPAQPETPPGKRYLILTYSVEFDRIHYPLALSYAGQADSGQLRNTITRLASELEKYKRQGKKSSGLARLQKDYDDLLREKEELEEAVETLQTQLAAVDRGGGGGGQDKKQLKMMHEVIRNLEEEVLQERTKHQRYVSKKTEELRSLTQELGELKSSERTLRSRVKNLSNELALLKKGMRSSPSSYLRPRHTPPSSSSSIFKKTPSSSAAGSGGRHRHRQRNSSTFKTSGSLERRIGRSNSGSLERKRDERRRGGSLERGRGRSGSHERRLALGVSNSRPRTPSPRGVGSDRWMRFDPSAYVEIKRRQQKEHQERFQRLKSPSYHSTGTHSRSSSLEKPVGLCSRSGSGGSLGRPPLGGLGAGSRRLWGSSERLGGARTRSSSLGSLSGCSSRGSNPAPSRGSVRRRPSLSDLDPSPPSSGRGRHRGPPDNRNHRKRVTGSSGRLRTSTPTRTSAGKPSGNKNNSGGVLLDHSAEMSEIDARLNALQQFMKRSLEATKSNAIRR
jgi:coiled-coil domain-containing protein 61